MLLMQEQCCSTKRWSYATKAMLHCKRWPQCTGRDTLISPHCRYNQDTACATQAMQQTLQHSTRGDQGEHSQTGPSDRFLQTNTCCLSKRFQPFQHIHAAGGTRRLRAQRRSSKLPARHLRRSRGTQPNWYAEPACDTTKATFSTS